MTWILAGRNFNASYHEDDQEFNAISLIVPHRQAGCCSWAAGPAKFARPRLGRPSYGVLRRFFGAATESRKRTPVIPICIFFWGRSKTRQTLTFIEGPFD